MIKHLVTENYRDRWSELPEGQFDLHKGDLVEVYNSGIGTISCTKENGSLVGVSGFHGYILIPIKPRFLDTRLDYILKQMWIIQGTVARGGGGLGASDVEFYNTYLHFIKYYYAQKAAYWEEFDLLLVPEEPVIQTPTV